MCYWSQIRWPPCWFHETNTPFGLILWRTRNRIVRLRTPTRSLPTFFQKKYLSNARVTKGRRWQSEQRTKTVLFQFVAFTGQIRKYNLWDLSNWMFSLVPWSLFIWKGVANPFFSTGILFFSPQIPEIRHSIIAFIFPPLSSETDSFPVLALPCDESISFVEHPRFLGNGFVLKRHRHLFIRRQWMKRRFQWIFFSFTFAPRFPRVFSITK